MRNALRGILTLVGLVASAVALATLVVQARAPQGPPLGFVGGQLVPPMPMLSGQEYDFPVEVVNHSGEPARLIGALEYCAGACYSVRGLPATVPANGRARVVVHIEARMPGAFEEEVTFYTDRPSQPQLILPVRGVTEAVDNAATTHATNP